MSIIPWRPARAIGWTEESLGYPIGPLLPEKTYLSSVNKCGACPCIPVLWGFSLDVPVNHDLSFLGLSGTFILKRQLIGSDEVGLLRYQDDTLRCRFITWYKKSAHNDLANPDLEQYFNQESIPDPVSGDPKDSTWLLEWVSTVGWCMLTNNPSNTVGGDFVQYIYKTNLHDQGKFRCKESNLFLPFEQQVGDVTSSLSSTYPSITLSPVYP